MRPKRQHALAHRLREATRTWFKLRAALLDAGIPRGERVRRFHQTVGASCSWGAGECVPGAALRTELDTAEPRWLGWMSVVYKRRHDTWVDFDRRRRAAVEGLRSADGPPSTLIHRACHASHAWLGHVSGHPETPPAAAIACRDVAWWSSLQCLAGLPGRTTEMWRHPRKNWQRHAESTLAAFAGPSWQEAAANRIL